MEPIRSFIAIELPETVKTALTEIQKSLKSKDSPNTKWVDPDGIHLTLKFLGNIDANKLDSIINTMKESIKGIQPFQLEIQSLGAFPNLRRVRVVWVGLNGAIDQLKTLQHTLETKLIPLGFPEEKRSFTPHLTLARVRETSSIQEQQALGERITNTKIAANLIIKVNSISLMRSQLTRTGAIYSCLSSVDL